MKKLLLVTALALTSAFVATPRSSAQSASFTFTPLSALSVAPGSTIQFAIQLNVVTGGQLTDIAGLTYFLQQTTGASPIFTITGRTDPTTNGSPFNDPITKNNTLLPDSMNSAPNFANTKDLGALYTPPSQMDPPGLPSGSYFIANITLQIAGNAAPGMYTVMSTTTTGKRSIVNDSSGFVTFPIQPGTLTVTVVPEPSTYMLIAFGGIALAAVAYRRRVLS